MAIKLLVGRTLGRLTLLHRFALTSLLVFVLIGVGIGYAVGGAVEHSAVKSAESAAVQTLQQRLISHLNRSDLDGPMIGPRGSAFDALVRGSVISHQIVAVKVWNPRGMIVYSNERDLIGRTFPLEDDVASALSGQTFGDVSTLDDAENFKERHFGRLLQVYVPIRIGGRIVGAFEIYESFNPIAAQISDLERSTDLVLAGGLLFLYLLLFGIVRAGSNTIERQRDTLNEYTEQLEASYRDTLSSLAAAVDARDSQTERHSERVTELALDLGNYIGLPEAELRSLHHGALLHDVGKIGVPDSILRKPGPLTPEEWTVMRRHPEIGTRMLRDVSFLQDAIDVVRHHHERWDGAGYPDGLAAEHIPMPARIFAIVDAFDAMTSDRPYRKGSTIAEALGRIEEDAGTHFDPVVATLFVGMISTRLPRVIFPLLPATEPGGLAA